MTLKIIFLLISIVVLTIFVIIVPVLGNESDEETDDEPVELILNDRITYENLKSFRQKYNEEILQYCKQNNLINRYEEDIMSVSLLYFTKVYDFFNLYATYIAVDVNVYVDILLSMKDDHNDELQREVVKFKSAFLPEITIFFKNLTFFPVPQDIENEYYLEQFRLSYVVFNSFEQLYGNSKVTVKQFIDKVLEEKSRKNQNTRSTIFLYDDNQISENDYSQFVVHYIKELHEFDQNVFPETEISLDNINFSKESNERKVTVNNYISLEILRFGTKWKFDQNDLPDIFIRYLMNDNIESHDIKKGDTVNVLENGVEKPMEVMPAFLKYFKESLNKYFKFIIGIDIEKITDENNKNLFYTKMLRTMSNIYNAYLDKVTDGINVSSFVQLMINKAEAILESNKTKNIFVIPLKIVIIKGEKSVQNYMAEYNKIKYYMPEKVEWKKVLDYLIHNIQKDSKA